MKEIKMPEKDYKEQNDKQRKYYAQDFSKLSDFTRIVRTSLKTGDTVNLKGLDLDNLIDKKNLDTGFFYITLFQEFVEPIRYGAKRKSLEECVNACIFNLRKNFFGMYCHTELFTVPSCPFRKYFI